ncbi:hypothetical protein FD755_024816 [Muntiacus reevesi]|uniref:TSPY n=1 Tax=Muntiacus reevesi TaxID=9886 RepID=A0A5N3UU44_MUNRE|nr:hypothetical protein FD755_024816 [Muntiacus reevesi]
MSGPGASAPARGHSQVPEEGERRPEEGGSVLGLRTFLAGGPGAQGARSPSPWWRRWRTARGRGGPLVDGDEAGIGRECQLLAEDERDQGSSQELEEKTVEEQGLERPRGPSERPAPNALQARTALQLEVSSLHEENRRAYVRLMRMNHLRRKRHLARRSAILQGIPGFWAKAIMTRLQMSLIMSTQDEDLLMHVIDLKVRYRAHRSTPVHYLRLDTRSLNFFNWVSGHNCSESNRIGELIGQDMWEDPLKYYPREEICVMRDSSQKHSR